jgi:hypothetical protein
MLRGTGYGFLVQEGNQDCEAACSSKDVPEVHFLEKKPFNSGMGGLFNGQKEEVLERE